MAPDGPYTVMNALGSSQVGSVWSAVDPGGAGLTVVMLDAGAAADKKWRDAFSAAVGALAQPQAGGAQFHSANLSAAAPWAAFIAGDGPGAERVFGILGVEYRPGLVGSAPATPVRSRW